MRRSGVRIPSAPPPGHRLPPGNGVLLISSAPSAPRRRPYSTLALLDSRRLPGRDLGLAAQHAELVALRVGYHDPAGSIGLAAVVDLGGAEPAEAVDLV